MADISVRQAVKGDAASLRRLNVDFNGDAVASEDLIAESLENNKQEIVCVAEIDNQIIGFCCAQIFTSMCYTKSHAEITELFVAKEYRRKGAAKKLMDTVEGICAAHGVRSFHLLTGQNNDSAQQFYKSAGYSDNRELSLVKQI